LKNATRPETYRGRIYDVRTRAWYFTDGSGPPITEEQRQEEMDNLPNVQQQNMEHARRLFHPMDFEKRKK
jgi:hypothetical protein